MLRRSTFARDRRRMLWDGRISDEAAARVASRRIWWALQVLGLPVGAGWAWYWLDRDESTAAAVAVAILVGWSLICLVMAHRGLRRAKLDTGRRYGLERKASRRLSLRSPERFDERMRAVGGIDTTDPLNRRGMGEPHVGDD